MTLTVGAAWRQAQRQLTAAGLDPAPREGQQLVAAVIGQQDSHLALYNDVQLTPEQEQAFIAHLLRRVQGEPLAYVLGVQPFWSRDWRVRPGVLIPRPDSEVLVQQVLMRLPDGPCRVAEVGVGSGALLGSVLLERADVLGVGTDIMPTPLQIAAQNFQEAGVDGRVQLQQTDMLEGIEGTFAEVFSNPPYIGANDYVALESGVREHEPREALLADDEGLATYKKLLPQAWDKLQPGGWLLEEIGATQGEAVATLFQAQGFTSVAVLHDLAKRDRVVEGRKA